MKVAIIGGTGKMGLGLATELSRKHEVYIGSRDRARGERAASGIPGAKGGDELTVAEACDVAVLSIPYEAVERLGALEAALAGKLVISPIVPMKVKGGVFYYALEAGSAAEQVASKLSKSRVAAALHTVPPKFFLKKGGETIDVLIAADERRTYDEAAALIGCLEGARPLYAGPLSLASSVESFTALLLNVAKLNGMKTPAVKFVS